MSYRVGDSTDVDLLVEDSVGVDLLKRRVITGTLTLALRRVFLQIIQTASTIILARILFPATFGQFAILIFIVEFLALLVSQGLVSALVQSEKKMSHKDVSTVFWFILIFSLVPFAAVWFFAGFFTDFWQNGLTISNLKFLAPAVFFINIKLILSSILERQVKYTRLVVVDIAESLVVFLVSIILALQGFALEALIAGYMAGKMTSAALLLFIGDFKVRFAFGVKIIKSLSSFAINYQFYSLVNSISGAIAPLYIGKVVGASGTGYLSWAGGIGLLPWAFAELIGRVSFPLFSRLQGDKKVFSKSFERALELNLLVVMPLSVIIFVFAEPVTNIIFTYKWLPAVGALRYFVLLGMAAAVNVVAQSALLALGKVKFVRNVSIFSAFCFWTLAIILIPKIGFAGHPLAWFLASCIQLLLVFKMGKFTKTSYFSKVFIYLAFSALATLPIFLLSGKIESLVKLIFVLLACLVFYSVLILVFRKNQLFFYFRSLRQQKSSI